MPEYFIIFGTTDTMKEGLKKLIRDLVPITEPDIELSLSYFKTQTLSKNTYLLRVGEICQSVVFVQTGMLRSFMLDDDGEERTTCFSQELDFVTSYESLITQKRSELSIQAIEGSQVLLIHYSDLKKLMERLPVWQRILHIETEKSFLRKEKYSRILNMKRVEKRYSELLKEIPDILQRVNLEQIASYLGVSRRTLTRVRKDILT